MKTLGLIGGTSPQSTAIYYRLLNELARERLGDRHSAKLLIWSFDFDVIDRAYAKGDWTIYRQLVVDAGEALKRAGAEGLMICSNTTHLAADAVAEATGLPLIHIVDALAAEIDRRGVRRPLLLGTSFVMSGPFYRDDLKKRFGVEAMVPHESDRAEVNRVIFEELVRGKIRSYSRETLRAMIARGAREGADGVILGCTELSLILSERDASVPVLDTTQIHAAAGSAYQFSSVEV
jgi:aspartate racemase